MTATSSRAPTSATSVAAAPIWPGEETEELSVFWFGTTLLKNRFRVLRWSLALGALAALSVIAKPRLFKATASFIPQGATDRGRSSLASLAGQFGVAIPASDGAQTPEFYASLLKQQVLLRQIALDTFVVREEGGRRAAFMDLFAAEESSPQARLETAVRDLTSMVNVAVDKATGMIAIGVTTPWRSVSVGVAQALLDGVNEFNLHTRQTQASAERKFAEGRLALASNDLRDAEDRLARFLVSNRQYQSSPELLFQHDRLQRDLTMKQGVYTSLSQAVEDARLREVHDTPVITVVQPPLASSRAEPRGRVMRTLLGLFAGALIGALLSLISGLLARRKQRGDAELSEFLSTLHALRIDALSRLPWIGSRFAR